MVIAFLAFIASAVPSALALFRSGEEQAIVELALRQQLAVYVHRHRKPRLSPLDRAFWVALSRLWPRWRSVLVLVQPETVVRWHRKAFRGHWRWISKPGPGRPPIPEETKALIVRMAAENGWRSRKIQAQLSKLGIRVGLTTISRYLPKRGTGDTPHQRWMTFLRNHRDVIAAMDFFVVPTATFKLLYVWFVLDHSRDFVGSVKRELLDHVVVFGEDHLCRLLREYVEYYNHERVHTSLGDAPEGRGVEERSSERSSVIGLPRVRGLHHRYAWAEAAG